jgi:hypothetical protein
MSLDDRDARSSLSVSLASGRDWMLVFAGVYSYLERA